MFATVQAAGPIKSIQVTLRGKNFDVEGVTTVKDVLGKMQESAGVEGGRFLFDGKQLALEDTLESMGVKEGDSLQMVPGSSPSKKKKSSGSGVSKKADSTSDSVTESSTGGPSSPQDFDLSSMWKQMNGSGEAPDMSESMDMMANMMQSPIFKEYMSDPEKLEASRQMILNNPLMKQMMDSMPGMKEVLESPEAWKEAMTAAAQLYETMDPEDLKQAMMGNMPGGGMPPVMPDTEATAALDELSEGDD